MYGWGLGGYKKEEEGERHLLVSGNKSNEEKFSQHPAAQSSTLGLMLRTLFPGVGYLGNV